MLEFYLVNGAKSEANNYYYSEFNTDPAKMIDYFHLEDADDFVPFYVIGRTDHFNR